MIHVQYQSLYIQRMFSLQIYVELIGLTCSQAITIGTKFCSLQACDMIG
jgi:hypothetical protein